MSTKNKVQSKGSGVNEHQAKTRLLLALWDIGASKEEVMKSQVTRRIVSKSQKVADYQGIFDQLEKDGAIAINKNKFKLSDKGKEILGESLKHPEVKFEGSIVGTWVANALVRWISQMDGGVNSAATNGKSADSYAIASYDKFKHIALDVYDQLNRDYNLDNLVPIYRIRREIGDRVSRSQFNEWLMEMQANDILQLQGGSVEDSAPDKIEDSITTELDGLRCYARLL
ncbi:MAG: hypothetical protein KME25_16190 [Symplocastrum torsivum CPER-KK1]|jgi:hypothetical protein|uniref:Uncharacterized protein n=1 Tax=Symplocastrum torsivum CPER-KK1 TaxID=450513 RepID=A0A951UAJ9_9CYAN|nr:hypothetical protein [Symplocastrum torsivum CPER-KK1]